MKNKTILSVVVLNYNAGKYLADCIESILKSEVNFPIEVVVGDNCSSDNSFKDASKISSNNKNIELCFIQLKNNWGFSAGNNKALKYTDPDSKYVLFLNPDTTVECDTFQKMVNFFESDSKVDAATCYINFAATGQLQPESHRGFPTPNNAFWHFFGFGLPKLFPKSKFFNGYFSGHLDLSKPVIIDACVGAFLMVKRKVGDAIGWWNEDYFMYGEDLEFCYKIKQLGFNLYFYPYARITHFQGISSGIKDHSKKKTKASRETKVRSAKATTNAMRIFYRNNLMDKYPSYVRPLITSGINFLEFYRVFKAKYL